MMVVMSVGMRVSRMQTIVGKGGHDGRKGRLSAISAEKVSCRTGKGGAMQLK